MRCEREEKSEMRDKHKRPPLTERLHDALDIPLACVSGMSSVEVFGGRQAVVSGCASVLLYTEEEVILRVYDGCIRLCGTGLVMQSLAGDHMTVKGEIHTVFIEKKKAGKA